MRRWITTRDAQAQALDPYYRWALLSRWRGLRRMLGRSLEEERLLKLRILVEVAPERWAEAMAERQRWTVPACYREPGPALQNQPLRFFTAEVALEQLPWLEGQPFGIRWELATPFRDAETASRASALGLYGERGREAFKALPLPLAGVDPRQPPPLAGALAVIDFGCPFLHTAFRSADGLRTRVQALWDQGGTARPDVTPWCANPRMGRGRQLGQAAMQQVLDLVLPGGALADDEESAYRRMDHLIAYDDPRRRLWGATHGAHVLAMAGGAPDPLTGGDDAAARAPLLFVQLPALTAADSSGASLGACVLDALHFLRDQVAPGWPLIINLSYGSHAGPHDGSSMIERAMDEFLLAASPNVALVLAAGNGHQAGVHQRRLVGADKPALLRLWLAPGDSTDSFVELWYAAPEQGELRLRLRSADGDWSDPIGPGQQAVLREDAQPVVMLRNDLQVPNGQLALQLLAFAPTARPSDDDGPLAPAGLWEIELSLHGSEATVAVDAWIERDDPGELAETAQSHWLDLDVQDSEQSLSSLATGRHTIVVGATRASDGAELDYSARGQRPPGAIAQVLAPAERDASLAGLRAAAVRSGETLLMNGSSVAAPVVARRLYNRLMHLHAQAQVANRKAVLQQQSRGIEDLLNEVLADGAGEGLRRR